MKTNLRLLLNESLMRRSFTLFGAVGLLLVSAEGIRAQTTYTWVQGGANTNWSTTGNWNPNSTPPSSLTNTIVDFDTTLDPSLTLDPVLDGARSVYELEIVSGSAGGIADTTANTNTLTIGAGGIQETGTSGPTVGTIEFTNKFAIGADQTWNIGGKGIILNGGISGSNDLTIISKANINFNAANSMTGNVELTGLNGANFTINIPQTKASAFGTGELTLSAANVVVFAQAQDQQIDNSTLDVEDTAQSSANFNTLQVNSSNKNVLVTSAVTGTGTLIVGDIVGSDNLIFSGNLSSFNGTLVSSNGRGTVTGVGGITTLATSGASGSSSSSATFQVQSGTTLALTGNTGTYFFGSLSGAGTINTTINVGDVKANSFAQTQQTAQNYLIQAGALNQNDVYSGVIGDNASDFATNGNTIALNKVGTGTMTLSGANTYTAGTTIGGGTLQFANILAMPASGNVSATAGTTLAVNVGGLGEFTAGSTSTNGSIGGLLNGLGGQAGSTVSFASGSSLGIDTTNAGGSVTYGGNIGSGAPGITKLGTGTLTLSGKNTYTSATTVNAGALSITGSLGNTTTTVNSGGTFEGTGSTAGAVNVVAEGTLAPGQSAAGGFGTLTAASVSLTSATFSFQLNSDLIAASNPGADLLSVGNAFTLNNTTFSATDLGSTTLSLGTVIDVASFGSLTGTFSGLADGSDLTIGANTFQINYGTLDAGDITLEAVAAPEPSTYGLLLGGLAVLLFLGKRVRHPEMTSLAD